MQKCTVACSGTVCFCGESPEGKGIYSDTGDGYL